MDAQSDDGNLSFFPTRNRLEGVAVPDARPRAVADGLAALFEAVVLKRHRFDCALTTRGSLCDC